MSSLVIAASTISYFKIADIMHKQVLETSANDIKSIQMSTETVINVLNNSLMQTALDNNLRHFSNRYELLSIFDIEDIYNRLYLLRAVNYYFKNLFVYYHNDGKVIDLNGNDARFIDLKEMKNKDMFIHAQELFEKERYSRKFSVYNLSIDEDETEMTMIMPVNPIDNKPNALIIMTLDRTFFQQLLLQSRIDEQENIYVIDNKGSFLFGKSADMKTINEPELKNENKGSLQVDVNKKKYLTTFITSEETGWKYIYEIPSECVFDKIKLVEIFLITLTLISLVFAGVITILVANFLHKPIRKVTRALISENKDESVIIKDEFKYINENIEHLIIEKKSIEQLLSENQPFLKNAALEKLITGTLLDSNTILKKLDHYNINILKNSLYAIGILVIDQFEALQKKYSDKQIDTLLIYQKEIIEDIIHHRPDISAEIIYSRDNQLILFLSINAGDKAASEISLKEITKRIFDELSANISISFTMGVSDICDDISMISTYYEHAINAYDYKIMMGTGSIIYFSDVPVLNKTQYRYPFKLEKDIFNCLKQPGMIGIDDAFENYFIHIKENMQNYDITKYSFIQLLNDTMKALTDLSINGEIVFPEVDNMYEQILSMETIDNVQKYFYDIFKEIHEYICITRSNDQNDVPKRIIDFIDNNYVNEISLESLASEMHYSVSYLVKVFRYATGKSIKEYITEKRIYKSKELLATKNMKIIDIAKKVGYSNTRSFINIFKKNVGVTPGEYKAELIKTNS